MLDHSKGEIWNRKSKYTHYNGQKKKKKYISTQHYTWNFDWILELFQMCGIFFDFHSIALKEYDLQWFIQIGCQIEEFVEAIFFSEIM